MGFLHVSVVCFALLVAKSGIDAATLAPPSTFTTPAPPVGANQPLLPGLEWLFTAPPPSSVASGSADAAAGGVFNVGGPFFTTTAPPSNLTETGNQQPPPSLLDILRDPALLALTGLVSDNVVVPLVVGSSLQQQQQQQPLVGPTLPQQPQYPNNLFNGIFPYFMGENILNLAFANHITSQLPGFSGALLANNALDLPDPWLHFQVARSLGNPANGGSLLPALPFLFEI